MSIRSYVKIKPISEKGAFTDGFNELRKGINRTGAVTESIGKNYVETHKLIKFEKEWLSDKQETDVDTANLEDKDDKKKHRGFLSRFVRMFRRNRRKETENAAEEGEKDADKEVDKKKKEAKGPMKSFLGMITGFLTPIFKFFLAMGVLDWLSKSPEKAQKVFKAIFAIAKFGWAVVGFGINKVMDGLTNLFGKGFDEGPIKRTFRFMGGFLQLASGIAALRFASYMIMPWKLITDVNRLKDVFGGQADQQGEAEAQAAWRKKGYKDKKTGVIYSEKEYKNMRKSARRAGKENAFQQRVGPTVKQRGRNLKAGALKKWRKGKGIIGKKMKGMGGKLSSPGMMKGVAVLGGATRIFSGIQSGEDATEAVGAGIGQAAGGMLGAAAGTALLGPFLGPFAPIVGNAIGGFLGEWVGKTFLPVIKPLFEPIKKYFELMWTLVQDVASETGIKDFLVTLFDFIGQIGKVMFDVIGWIMKPIGWLLGGVIKVLAGTIKFIISAAKNIFAFMTNPIGFAWKIIRGKDPGKDVKLEEMAKGGPLKLPQYFLGGLFKKKEKWEVLEEVHVEGVLRSIKWQDMNQLPKYKVTKDTILEGNTYPEFDAEQIRLGLHKGEQDSAKPGEKKEKTGIAGFLGGVADTLTGGIFDFDGKGNSPLQHLQQLPLKLAGMAAKGVIGAGKKIVGGIGNVAKGLWGGVKGLFGGKKEEITPTPEEKPAYSDLDMRSQIEAQVLRQQEQHNALQWKKEKDATVRDVILPPRTVIMKQTNTQINTIKTGTISRRVSTVPSPMFVC